MRSTTAGQVCRESSTAGGRVVESSRSIVARRLSGSAGSKSAPGSATISTSDEVLLAIVGVPHAMASATGSPKPS
jgi:hypothetical protein